MKKRMRQKTNVTLPLGNKEIFEALGEIAFSVEDNRKDISKDEFVADVVQELGKDAFLFSFTPSGEIGDGHNTKDNPQTPRIAQSFYDGLSDLLGVEGEGADKDGSVTKMLKANISSEKVFKTRMVRFKGAIINLVQLYLESDLRMTATDRNSYGQRKRKDKVARERVTSFNYKQRPRGMDDTEWFNYLIGVEENRYVRMFVAVIFFKTISDLFLIKSGELYKTMKAQDLLGVEGKSAKTKFKIMRQAPTREEFVRRVRQLWNLELRMPKTKGPASKRKVVEEVEMEEMELPFREPVE